VTLNFLLRVIVWHGLSLFQGVSFSLHFVNVLKYHGIKTDRLVTQKQDEEDKSQQNIEIWLMDSMP